MSVAASRNMDEVLCPVVTKTKSAPGRADNNKLLFIMDK